MCTRKCEGCGWEYPITYTNAKCRFCGSLVEGAKQLRRRCPMCNEIKLFNTADTYCRSCKNEYARVEIAKFVELEREWQSIAEALMKYSFTDRISKIPKPYKFLTEKEWYQTCSYFNGCALCGADEISTRAFFIPFKDGGRYCAWNVIPLCEECTTRSAKAKVSPFSLRPNKYYNPERIKIISDYLSTKFKEILNEHTN